MNDTLKNYFNDNFFKILLTDESYLEEMYTTTDEVAERYKQVEAYINSNIYIQNDIAVISYNTNYFNMYISLVYNDVIEKSKCLRIKFETINNKLNDFDFNLSINNKYILNKDNTLQHIKDLTLDILKRYSYLVYLNDSEVFKHILSKELYESLMLESNIKQSITKINKLNKI